jgi:phospholipid/cholesterol/gamma-HCH transport system substrate-binding protein
MSARSDRLKAGVFVVSCVTLFVVIFAVVAGMRVAKKSRTFFVRFTESVTGLEPSSTVRYYGVPIGRVSDIGFAADAFPEIEVRIEVHPDAPIRADTQAVLKAQGLTGISYIDLEKGSDDARLLDEFETIRARASVTVQLMDTLAGLKGVIENLNMILSENREAIGAAVAKIDRVAESARPPLERLDEALAGFTELTGDLRREVADASRSAREALGTVTGFLTSPSVQALPERMAGVLGRADALFEDMGSELRAADLAGLVEKLGTALGRLEETTERLDAAVADVHAGVTENRGSLTRIIMDLRGFSVDLRGLARDLRSDPSRLVIPRRVPEREEGR